MQGANFYEAKDLSRLFSWVAVITCVGLIAAYWVVLTNMRMLKMGSHAHQVELRLPGKAWPGTGAATRKASGVSHSTIRDRLLLHPRILLAL